MPSPCADLIEVLEPAYSPCPNFSGPCSALKWNPAKGYAPHGFCGGTGSLEDIRLVLVTAEPGDPGDPGDEKHYNPRLAPCDLLKSISSYVYEGIKNSDRVFHRNLKYILDRCWPGLSFDEQMKRTWITESVLCSAPVTTGRVDSEKVCADAYLRRQVELLGHAYWVAMGRKAERRLRFSTSRFAYIPAPAPPGGNMPSARAAWDGLGEDFQAWHQHC